MELKEALEKIEQQESSIGKLEKTNRDLKEERDTRKVELETLKTENTELNKSKEEFDKFNKEANLKGASDYITTEHKGKEKFVEDTLRKAGIDNFDVENKEHTKAIAKVFEDNPEYKQDINDLGAKTHMADMELNKKPSTIQERNQAEVDMVKNL